MKLKRISKIDNFSIFKNFDWDSNLSYQNGGSTKIYDFKDHFAKEKVLKSLEKTLVELL